MSNTVEQLLASMSQEELDKLAMNLVWQHEGVAEKLHTFIGWAQQDKYMVAREEDRAAWSEYQ